MYQEMTLLSDHFIKGECKEGMYWFRVHIIFVSHQSQIQSLRSFIDQEALRYCSPLGLSKT